MNSEEEIFDAASALQRAERAAYLDVACAAQPEMRARIEVLLRSHEAPGFMDGTAWTSDAEVEQAAMPQEAGGEPIGRYRLAEKIGEGGFGVVWVAEQLEPVRRTVALKIIKPGMDSREVIARFEAERQALAMMDHPNIAKVFDAGTMEAGRPFFAMELVRGVRITEFCDQANMPTEERLGLFATVCQAVQHAHQKGIIHRDLKPSNILVAPGDDGQAVPKVIDFGVAKAVGPAVTDGTVYTQFEQMIGTPAYMSPEQAGLGPMDIDTRSDIYSLGVLLYELLTGLPPFDPKELLDAGLEEMRRVIREVDPPKPSTRLPRAQLAGRNSAGTKSTVRAPRSAMVQDLDWIVMKAIEKDRTRRYETANGLALDIQRLLASEPVSAGPPTAGYRFRKFATRNRMALRVCVGVAAVLVAATVVSSWQAWRATQAEDRANRKTADEKLARQDAEAISTFLTRVFKSADPERDGRTITVAEVLDKASRELRANVAIQPSRRIRLLAALGATYDALGLASEAIPLEKEVRDYYLTTVGPEHDDTLDAAHNLAISYHDAGLDEEALKLREELLPLRLRVNGPEDRDTLEAMTSLANSYYFGGRLEEALKLREEVAPLSRKALGPEDPRTLMALSNLAASYSDANRLNEALQLQEELLPLMRRVNGEKHSDTLSLMNNLGVSWDDAGRREAALKLREELLVLRRAVNGPRHFDTLKAMGNLANSYFEADRLEEALRMQEELLEISRTVNGKRHYDTLGTMKNLARSYVKAGRLREAEALREEMVGRTVPTPLALATTPETDVASPQPRTPPVAQKNARTLVAPGSEWKWLHPADGSDPGQKVPGFHKAFAQAGFDDSQWSRGRDSDGPTGGFGYGLHFTGVDIGFPEDKTQRWSAYFRHAFTTDTVHRHLELRCQRDDGMIVYLDGKEVVRDNVEPGEEAYQLRAVEAVDEDDDSAVQRYAIPGELPPGPHVLAISVHNCTPASTDLRLGGVSLVDPESQEKSE